MNPGQQLHRSLTFWAGLIIILFTSWAWWDSNNHVSATVWRTTRIESNHHGLQVTWHPHFQPASSHTRIETRSQSRALHNFFPPPFFVHFLETWITRKDILNTREEQQVMVCIYGPGSWALFIPYWLILPPILLIWTCLLLWRAHRHRRAITPPAQRHSD